MPDTTMTIEVALPDLQTHLARLEQRACWCVSTSS